MNALLAFIFTFSRSTCICYTIDSTSCSPITTTYDYGSVEAAVEALYGQMRAIVLHADQNQPTNIIILVSNS